MYDILLRQPYLGRMCTREVVPKKCFVSKIIFADTTVKYAPLQVVVIFFDTATYDEIERDVKVALGKPRRTESAVFFNIVQKGWGRGGRGSNPCSKILLQILYNFKGLLAT